MEIIFNCLGMILANKKINFEYKNNITYKSSKTIKIIKEENAQISKNIGNVFFHKLAGFIVGQTDAILISIFSNLKETGIYSNYIMIISALTGLLGNVIGSIMPSIGNLIAEESKEKSYQIFRKLYLMDNLLAGFISFGVYKLIDEFIIFWVGKGYLFPKYIIITLSINLYIQISRGSIDRFKEGFGIYWDVVAPIIESLVNLIFSLLLAWNFGIVGVFIGTIISNILIIEIWKPYILFKEGFNIKLVNYVKQKLNILIRNILTILFSNFLYEFIN
ncbi:lipopolysaccharide biosynthesis protein, partial [Clostridium perfringens]|uniref:lipopolysaccharide biosynthesis protein n=1 Tax=Clostridium perfringens TaxID=1502 RepID=UPI003C6C7690